jgi:hypothetical protein
MRKLHVACIDIDQLGKNKQSAAERTNSQIEVNMFAFLPAIDAPGLVLIAEDLHLVALVGIGVAQDVRELVNTKPAKSGVDLDWRLRRREPHDMTAEDLRECESVRDVIVPDIVAYLFPDITRAKRPVRERLQVEIEALTIAEHAGDVRNRLQK